MRNFIRVYTYFFVSSKFYMSKYICKTFLEKIMNRSRIWLLENIYYKLLTKTVVDLIYNTEKNIFRVKIRRKELKRGDLLFWFL